MQFKLAFVSAALATLAVATPAFPRGGSGGEPASSCSTGPVQCSTLLGLLGIVLQDLTVGVGLTCDPITSVCCQDNSHGGLISIGCVPVTL
ncbi:fungal hydrophobin [Gymnopus androsaceus JB14]|uniref:Hydrophobin n=1 Tax=Gymnopus androsaceus JB14 TaxID=1447944 RepID=A0A6A4IE70_9AGAR|nr:fungal hydrophobin [Gymnopus androsaceus JB14]